MNAQDSVAIAYRWLSQPGALRGSPDAARAAKFRRQCRRWLDNDAISGLGIGSKRVAGIATSVPALCVYVRSKNKHPKAGTEIPPLLYLPGDLRPVLTDVVQSTKVRAACAPGGDIRNASSQQNAGTATVFLEKIGEPGSCYLLGCAHVLAPAGANTGDTIQCRDDGWFDAARLTSRFARLKPGTHSTLPDFAIAQLPPGSQPDLRVAGAGIKIAAPVRSSVQQDEILTVHGCVDPLPKLVRVINPAMDEDIQYTGNPGFKIRFSGLIRTSKGSEAGDSGAPVLDQNDRLVGYVIGNSDSHTLIQPVAELLQTQSMRLFGAGGNAFSLAMNDSGMAVAPTLSVSGAIDTLARTIWGEARGEKENGRIAVAWVILNRSTDSKQRFPRSVEQVCLQPWQFSCWNKKDPNLHKLKTVTDANTAFRECLQIAAAAVSGKLPPDTTGGANHYHTTSLNPLPKWAKGVTATATIGAHIFYRL